MTCPSTFTFFNGLCYGPCNSGWEPNTEDFSLCVELGCPSYTTKSAADPAIPATCLFSFYPYTNAHCQKNVLNDPACACAELYNDNGTGSCEKYTVPRVVLWPKCSAFEHYDGHECTFNISFFIFVILFLALIVLVMYIVASHKRSAAQQYPKF